MSYFCAIFIKKGRFKPVKMISATKIKQLSEVAKVGSLKISSLNLCVSESALNMCIFRAEEELGVTLFSRKDHSLIITESSKSVFDLFERLLELFCLFFIEILNNFLKNFNTLLLLYFGC